MAGREDLGLADAAVIAGANILWAGGKEIDGGLRSWGVEPKALLALDTA